IRTPLSEPLTPSMANPPRSSVTLSASILIPLLPLSPTMLFGTQYDPGWPITNDADASPGVLTLLTSIHAACAAQDNNDMRATAIEPTYLFFIDWVFPLFCFIVCISEPPRTAPLRRAKFY